jgi:hypothetical protein
MKKQKELLARSFETYLLYDQIMDTSWRNPFSGGAEKRRRIKRDAEKMAELAIHELRRELKK